MYKLQRRNASTQEQQTIKAQRQNLSAIKQHPSENEQEIRQGSVGTHPNSHIHKSTNQEISKNPTIKDCPDGLRSLPIKVMDQKPNKHSSSLR
jgi:hypothetical protein